jgi:hypothetical protein
VRYRERVAIEAPADPAVRDASGAVVPTWVAVSGLTSVPATLLPESVEVRAAQSTPTTAVRQAILAGRHDGITTLMSLVAGGIRYDIDTVELLVGLRQTVLHVRRAAV